MTTKHTAQPSSGPQEHFPERPRRTDMQNFIHLNRPGHATALARHLGAPETTLVIGDTPVGRSVHRQPGILYPDLMVAFHVDCPAVLERHGFAIDEQGKPPDFVLEIASLNTAYNDYTHKRRGYAEYGIPEYWRFDNTGGRYYPEPLAGDRLADGEYRPIAIIQTDEGRYWGRSEVLNLSLCWEYGQLRWYDPVGQRYLRTHGQAEDDRLAAESQRNTERQARLAAESQRSTERQARLAAESQRSTERQARLAAESQRNTERQARLAAETEAAEAQARIQQLEEELRRRSQ